MIYTVLVGTGVFFIVVFTGVIVYELILEATRTWRFHRARRKARDE